MRIDDLGDYFAPLAMTVISIVTARSTSEAVSSEAE
jgi:hypothetical protein